MKLGQIRWGLALAGALGAEIVMVAAAIVWVSIYSCVLHPVESLVFYR